MVELNEESESKSKVSPETIWSFDNFNDLI